MGTLFAFSQLYIGLTQNARHNLGIFPAGEMEAVPVWACRYGLDPPELENTTMSLTKRVSVIMPFDRWLSTNQNALKWGIVDEIEALGYQTEIFFDPRGKAGLAADKAWSASEADRVTRRCVGAVLIGMPRWSFSTPQGAVNLPTEFCYYEGAIAYTLRLPMLMLVQQNVVRRAVFNNGYGGYVGEFPEAADRTWLTSEAFRVPFGLWKRQLEQKRDVFLGYCSSSEATATSLKRFLQEDVGVTVLDWKTDFAPGSSLEQIAEAASRCSAGKFLFTGDDQLTDRGHKDKAAPRDNVVFEAGYSTSAKGKDHVLIVREAGAKMPADLEGDIYASLQDKSKIAPIKETIRRFVDGL